MSALDFLTGLKDDEDWGIEDDGKTSKFITTFDDVKTRKTVEFAYRNVYIPRWTCKEAFREIYQNWRDGLLRSFSLPLRRFCPKYSERDGLILVEKFDPDSGKLLGYIRFKYNKEGYGQLEVTNFRASLEYAHLKIGALTKAGDPEQAGGHGEGFKIAALIFRRYPNNYTFRIESSGVSCNFIFNQSLDLACSITRISNTKIADAKRKVKGRPRPLASDPSRDVSVFIGELENGTTSDGRETRGNKISVYQFRVWLKVILDINPPAAIVRTDCGDLIMDPAYRNQFFVRGLKLTSGSTSGKLHRYGYNFIKGDTTRDRESKAKPKQEAHQIGAIWTKAILAGGVHSSELLATWTDLLMNSLNELDDVNLVEYRSWLKKDLMRLVWAHMRTLNKSEDGRDAFYYSPTAGKGVANMITHSLQRHPVPLTSELWDILRWFELPRTPQEEQRRRFSRAVVIDTPTDTFAKNIEWMLQCCIQSHPEGERMGFDFVDGKELSIDAAFFRPTWKIHSKWLTFEGTHQNTFCEQHCPGEEDPFCCDHAILRLWSHEEVLKSRVVPDLGITMAAPSKVNHSSTVQYDSSTQSSSRSPKFETLDS